MALLPETIHVLLVDDEQLSRFVVGNLLRKCNYAVTVVDSGKGALDILRRSAPGTFQLILTDLMMPEVDGLDILRYVRGTPALSDLPVIVMSANEQKDTVFQAIRGGAEEYLVKPVTRKEVQNIWQHVWKRTSSQQQLQQQATAQQQPPQQPPQQLQQPVVQQQAGDGQAAVAATPGGLLQLQEPKPQQQQQQQQAQHAARQELVASMQELHQAAAAVQQPLPPQPQQQPASLRAAPAAARAALTLQQQQQQQQQQPAQQQHSDYQSLAFFLGTLHGHRSAQVADMRSSLGDLDAQIAAVQAALEHQQQQHQPVLNLGSSPAALAPASSPAAAQPEELPAAEAVGTSPCAASQQQPQPQQHAANGLAEHASAGAARDDDASSSEDEMDRRERRGPPHKRQRLLLEAQPALMSRANSGSSSGLDAPRRAACMAAGSGELVPAAAAAPAPGMLPRWQHIAGRFDVLETVYLRHKQAWEQQQPAEEPAAGGAVASSPPPAPAPAAATPTPAARSSSGHGAWDLLPGGRPLPAYLQDFGEDLWGYGRYSRLAARGTVRAAGDVLGGGCAMVCATACDRDDEYVATAGVSKRIRIYEYAAITSAAAGGGGAAAAAAAAAGGQLGGSPARLAAACGGGGASDGNSSSSSSYGFGGCGGGGHHGGPAAQQQPGGLVYPLLELSSRSRLSSVAWSPYIKAQLASADYEGVVQLWDANTGSELMQFEEHGKRAWAVEFSPLEPTRLVSCSDDGSVKLWSIHQEGSLATLQLRANVCSVAFSPDSPHLLAAGCAHHRFSLYDLRNTASPLVVVPGHRRSVSYVRWLGGASLVTASTDNTLRLWSTPELLAAGASAGGGGRELSSSATAAACQMTYRGHTNNRNFIGLAVLPGSPGGGGGGSGGGLAGGGRAAGGSGSGMGGGAYIACGSETNEVFAYHSSVPVPITSHSLARLSLPCAWGRGGGSASDLHALADPAGGKGDTFVSAVAWNRRHGTLIAANSAGHFQVLELV